MCETEAQPDWARGAPRCVWSQPTCTAHLCGSSAWVWAQPGSGSTVEDAESGARSKFTALVSAGMCILPSPKMQCCRHSGSAGFQEQLQPEVTNWDRCNAHHSSSSALQEWLVTPWGDAAPCRVPRRHEGITRQKKTQHLFNKKGLQNILRIKTCFPVIYTNIIHSQIAEKSPELKERFYF